MDSQLTAITRLCPYVSRKSLRFFCTAWIVGGTCEPMMNIWHTIDVKFETVQPNEERIYWTKSCNKATVEFVIKYHLLEKYDSKNTVQFRSMDQTIGAPKCPSQSYSCCFGWNCESKKKKKQVEILHLRFTRNWISLGSLFTETIYSNIYNNAFGRCKWKKNVFAEDGNDGYNIVKLALSQFLQRSQFIYRFGL